MKGFRFIITIEEYCEIQFEVIFGRTQMIIIDETNLRDKLDSDLNFKEFLKYTLELLNNKTLKNCQVLIDYYKYLIFDSKFKF